MADMASNLSAREMAELAALADGSLPAARRSALEARIAASPELQELLERQRTAIAATRAAAAEPVPASLRARVEGSTRRTKPRRRRVRLVPGLALGSAVAAAAAIVLALVLTGGPSGPTVADAARLAATPPSEPAPHRLDHSRSKLAVRVDGVTFPDLARAYGWRPVGVRRGEVNGRAATVVYYEKGGKRIGYVILAGSALPSPSGAQSVERRGVPFKTLEVGGHPTVTWKRLGHTCVLTGATSRSQLLALASWRGGGTLRY
jgi:anti-sigma factor RsiW